MNILLLSGGSGKRLWPLSNDMRSKQFLRLFKTKNGKQKSMVQRVYRQIKEADADACVTAAAGKGQEAAIRNQLGEDVGISIEPCRRDTFPAIALAAAYLSEVRGLPPEEPVVICPIDVYAKEDYFSALKEMEKQAARGEAKLILMGIEPTGPSEKYGYVIPASADPVSFVVAFREKPDAETAREYIRQGALWNGGVFACRLGYLLDKTRELLPFTGYRNLLLEYGNLPKISFDYAVVEKEKTIQVLRFHGEWKDIGTWNALTEVLEENRIGDAVLDETCRNVHVINELDVPILAMGLRDVVISASPEGILVSDKERSVSVKPFAEKLARPIRFAEKSWGNFRVLDAEETSLTAKLTLKEGGRMSFHSHKNRDEIWVVISGRGYTVVDGMEEEVQTGDVITIQAGCFHTIIAESELKLVEIQLGGEISVHDKQKRTS